MWLPQAADLQGKIEILFGVLQGTLTLLKPLCFLKLLELSSTYNKLKNIKLTENRPFPRFAIADLLGFVALVL